jgi:hypothetical protein
MLTPVAVASALVPRALAARVTPEPNERHMDPKPLGALAAPPRW